MPSTAVLITVPYTMYDGCSADGLYGDGWNSIIKVNKPRRLGRLPGIQGHYERPREAFMCEK